MSIEAENKTLATREFEREKSIEDLIKELNEKIDELRYIIVKTLLPKSERK
ncbi:MAG: hypothetical protein ACTSX6_09970 [Candidatus Heimdallarchaeaceae archaeon]